MAAVTVAAETVAAVTVAAVAVAAVAVAVAVSSSSVAVAVDNVGRYFRVRMISLATHVGFGALFSTIARSGDGCGQLVTV